MHIPTDLGVNLKPDEDTPAVESFIPQTCTHTWVRITCSIKLRTLLTPSHYLLDWTHKGCFGYSVVPQEWTFIVECQYGY